MDHVLWIAAAVVGVGVWSYTYSLGGPVARSALTLGIHGRYAPTVASYRPGSPTWARLQVFERNPDHVVRDPAAHYFDLIEAPPIVAVATWTPVSAPAPADQRTGWADELERLSGTTPDWAWSTPARGVATVPPVLGPDDSVAVQHAVALHADDSYEQLAKLADTGVHTSWDAFQSQLLGTLHADADRISIDGWGTGQWRAAPMNR